MGEREKKTHHTGRAFIENFIEEREERGERERGCMASWGEYEGEQMGLHISKGGVQGMYRDHTAD